jgi:hypothetical protein
MVSIEDDLLDDVREDEITDLLQRARDIDFASEDDASPTRHHPETHRDHFAVFAVRYRSSTSRVSRRYGRTTPAKQQTSPS